MTTQTPRTPERSTSSPRYSSPGSEEPGELGACHELGGHVRAIERDRQRVPQGCDGVGLVAE
jgi:hypothetical protein